MNEKQTSPSQINTNKHEPSQLKIGLQTRPKYTTQPVQRDSTQTRHNPSQPSTKEKTSAQAHSAQINIKKTQPTST